MQQLLIKIKIVTEVDTLHAALNRLLDQCQSSHHPTASMIITDITIPEPMGSVNAVRAISHTSDSHATVSVNDSAVGGDTMAVEPFTIVKDTPTIQSSANARGLALDVVVNPATTVGADNAVEPVAAFGATSTSHGINACVVPITVPPVDAIKIVERVNHLKAITTGDSIRTVESVNAVNAINTNQEFAPTIHSANADLDASDALVLGLTSKSDAEWITTDNDHKAFAGIDSHSIKNTTLSINKDSNGTHIAADFRAPQNNDGSAAQNQESMEHVNKNMTRCQKVSTHVVQTVPSELSEVSPPTSTVTLSFTLSPPISPRTVRKESISPTPDTSYHGRTPLTPPSSPPIFRLLDGRVKAKGRSRHLVKNARTPPHTSEVVKKLIVLHNAPAPPSTPDATDDDVHMWGPGCSPRFNSDIHKAQIACDALEQAWLNRRLDASINKWERAKWWTVEGCRARAYNWGMRRTINPAVKAHIYEIPDDISFAVDDDLDLACGSSIYSSSDGGHSQVSTDSAEMWGRRMVEIKAGLKVHEL